jgi:glycosyltransferase involved in cell wall biosynthesis
MEKILHVLSSKKYSGAENVAITIIDNLSEKYSMAYASPDGSISNVLENKKIEYIPLKSLSIINLRKEVGKWNPSVLHAHDFKATLICIFVAGKIPVISHIHQNPLWLKKINIRSIIFQYLCFKVEHVVGVTPALLEIPYLTKYIKRKITIIKNIGDIKEIRIKANEYKSEEYDIAFVGRLVDVKDPLRFIRVISKISKEFPDIKTVMVGDGILKKECCKYIKELGLEKNIHMKGFLNNPLPILNKSKLLLITSKTEGLPMTLTEALSLGKPVLVTKISGIEEVIDTTCGLITDNDEEFINKIMILLRNKQIYLDMSGNAEKKAEKIFNMIDYKKKLIKVYTDANALNSY